MYSKNIAMIITMYPITLFMTSLSSSKAFQFLKISHSATKGVKKKPTIPIPRGEYSSISGAALQNPAL